MSNEDLQRQIEEAKAQIDATKQEIITAQENVVSDDVSLSQEETQLSEMEQKAVEMGWDPNHKGPNFVSAKEFVERGSLFRKIEAKNKEIEEIKNIVKELSEHNKKVEEAAYNRGIQEALQRRREALELGDVNAFDKAEADLHALNQKKQTLSSPPAAQPAPAANPEVSQDMIEFVQANKTWFNNSTPENQRMVAEADGLFYLELKDNPNISHKEALEKVKAKIMILHPEKFENPNKSKAPAVMKSSSAGSSNKSDLASKLTERQLKFIKTAQRLGSTMTIEEYAKQLQSTGELRNE